MMNNRAGKGPVGAVKVIGSADDYSPKEAPKAVGPVGKVKVVGKAEEFETNTGPTASDIDYERLFLHIAEREGSGDKITSVPTAHFGVTGNAAKAVGKKFSKSMSKEESKEIGKLYVKHLDDKFKGKVVGWEGLPVNVREAVLDTAYNVGPQILNWKGFVKGLSELDFEAAAENLLDTASTEGRASKGIAKRRAEQYNAIIGEQVITEVEQLEDGTLKYLSGDKEVFSYKPSGGRHPTSKPGRVTVVDTDEYADMSDGWYKDPDTGEKFEIKKGKRL